jgi:hypothetical protein
MLEPSDQPGLQSDVTDDRHKQWIIQLETLKAEPLGRET